MSDERTARPGPQNSGVPHPGNRKSFKRVESEARKVLREKGLSEDQIDRELKRATRKPLDS